MDEKKKGLRRVVIPEHAAMKYYVRATTVAGVEELKKKIIPCFQ